jgi:hypothetical protein
LEDALPSDPKTKELSFINTSQINMIQKHQGIFRTRGILYQGVKERQYQRGLGLVIVTQTTTKWRASRVDNSFYLETKLHISLDPKSDPLTRLRLFCVTVFDGTPRYEPGRRPRISNYFCYLVVRLWSNRIFGRLGGLGVWLVNPLYQPCAITSILLVAKF